jgi:hypothetical protein
MAKSRNTSELRPFNFSVVCERLPNSTFFLQDFQIPELSIEPVNVPTLDATTPFYIPGDGVRSGDKLLLTMKLDEDMKCWFDFYDWMTAIRHQDDIKQHMLAENPALYSDLTVVVRGNNQQRISHIVFRHCWPTRLGSFNFKTTADRDEIITFTAELQTSSFIAIRPEELELPPKGEPQ